MAFAPRLLAPVAAPPPPKPPQLSLIASALMPDTATDTLGPGRAPALAAAGWVNRGDGKDGRRIWDRPPGDRLYRETVEYRNALVAATEAMGDDEFKRWWEATQESLTAAAGVMADVDMLQREVAAGVTYDTLPESVFPATATSRWTGGFAYAPENQYKAQTADPCGQVVDLPGTGPGAYGNLPQVQYVPFLIQVEDECSTFGWSERDFTGRALRLLDNATPNAIEREFWSGAFARNTLTGPMQGMNAFLTQTAVAANGGSGLAAVDLTPGTLPSVTRGIQILEDYLANTGFGGQGMLHVSPQTSPNLLGARRVGSLLLSVVDNIIVPGSGYPTVDASGNNVPSGPIGNANATPPAGSAWIFATDLVSVRLDEPRIYPSTLAEAVDRGNLGSQSAAEVNTIRFRAERFAAATFDGARLAACRVSLTT